MDDGAKTIATKAPTVHRIALYITESIPEMKTYTPDITQACTQSHSKLERYVNIMAPEELGLGARLEIRTLKPLYGIAEPRLHWYNTYLVHHLETVNMICTQCDPCVLIRLNKGKVYGLIILQFGDSLGIGTPRFLEEKEEISKKFQCKQGTSNN